MKSQHDIEMIVKAVRQNEIIRNGEHVPLGTDVMRCKLKLHTKSEAPSCNGDAVRQIVRFGAVWEGSVEAQAASENAVFGKQTPCAEFNATICNTDVLDKLEPGASYIVTFTKAEQQ